MLKRSIVVLVLSLCAPFVLAAEYGLLVPERSRIAFTSKQMGVPVEGEFKRYKVDVSFDPQRPETGRARIEVEVDSIDAGSKDANDEVRSKGWFDVKRFPVAAFVAEAGSVRALGGNRFEARGKMSIKGRTRDVVVPFTYGTEGTEAVLEGSIPILRTQYGIGEGAWSDTSVVADEVPVRFRLVLKPR